MKHIWVKDQKPIGEIIIPKTANESERFAASELSSYFEKISGARLPEVQGVSSKRGPGVIILDASRPSNHKFLKAVDWSKLANDGFFIKSDGPDLLIGSKEPSGIVFGVYQYLTIAFGVRFFDYGSEGEDVPYMDSIHHEALDILKNPRLSFRCLQNPLDIRRIDWMAKNGFNYARIHATPSLEWWNENLGHWAPEYKKRGIKIAFGHHLFERIIPEELYLEENPEYFPAIDKRRQVGRQFSWSLRNKEVIDEVIYRLEDFLSIHPEIDILDFWPADGIYHLDKEDFKFITGGEEPKSGEWEKHMHGKTPYGRLGDPNKAKIYALLIKPVAEALGKRFPALKISTLHYVDLIQPCPEVTLPQNVIPVPTIYWRCIKHDLLDDECVYNSQFKKVLREWTRQYPDRMITLYEYYMGMGAHGDLPYPSLTSLFKEWDGLVELGIGGAHLQSHDTHTVPYNINYLAFAALAWENPPTMEEFLKDYCHQFFGNAGDLLYEMYDLWEEGCQHALDDTQPKWAFFTLMFSEQRVKHCLELLYQAMRKADDPKVIYRVSRLIVLMKYASQVVHMGDYPYKLMKKEKDEGADVYGELDRHVAPRLEGIVNFVRRVQELNKDIFVVSSDPQRKIRQGLYLEKICSRSEKDIWERQLGQLRGREWEKNEFNPDVAEKELARIRKGNQDA